MKAIRLRTEYLADPLGIDIAKPRLFWNCQGGVRQTAWQITAQDEAGGMLWDTGKAPGGAMRAIWDGPALGSRAAVRWRVRLWDENGEAGPWSEPAQFELGLLAEEDWRARWITGDYTPRTHKALVGDYLNKNRARYPVDCFKKVFSLPQGVQKARLYITACGLYEAELNGARVGNFVLAPGVTDYRRRVQYQTYDVAALLRPGENTITVQLADGWYRGATGAWGLLCQYGDTTKLLAQLELTLVDGTMHTIGTDESWQWSSDGPIRFADNKDGEVVDANRAPTYGGSARPARHAVTPTASNNVPLTEHERFGAKLLRTPAGKAVLNFGQNLAGYVEFTLNAHQGQTVTLRFGELLDGAGEFTQKNIQCRYKSKVTPLQQVVYTCKEGVNRYKTRFAIFGFQYVQVETPAPFTAEDFTAVAVYSDLERTGWFDSSNALLNKFVEATVWSAKGNFADLPTDCPTRERHGWTGDAQIFFGTAAYLFDYAAFGRKYLNDVYDAQRKDGCLPQIAPAGGTDFFMGAMDGSVGWADIGVLLPYRYWKQYGDTEILRASYGRMRKYAQFMERRCGKWYIMAKPLHLRGRAARYAVNCGQCYGEWAEPADIHPNTWKDCAIPQPEVQTAYTAHVMQCMAEIADALQKPEDAAEYRGYAEGCREAYRSLCGKPAFSLDTDRQARLVRPLAFGLLDERQAAYAEKRLIQALEHYGWRLGTGFLSTPLILDVLADIDIEHAYRLLENEEMPGWLFMPKNGATTVWESWEGTRAQSGIASLNHYSKGAVCEWLFRAMCGIRVAGENRFVLAPRPGGHFAFAKAAYQSVYGRVESGWRREAGATVYTVAVPANCTAEVHLPGGTARTLQAGTYEFREEQACT